jgi:hypothetical protein
MRRASLVPSGIPAVTASGITTTIQKLYGNLHAGEAAMVIGSTLLSYPKSKP